MGCLQRKQTAWRASCGLASTWRLECCALLQGPVLLAMRLTLHQASAMPCASDSAAPRCMLHMHALDSCIYSNMRSLAVSG